MKLNNKMLFGILGGLAAGVIAGILIAPGKGSKTIENINMKGKTALDNLRSLYSDIAEKAFIKSRNKRDKFGESHLDRTKSTASQFNLH